jgi:hypothetical protein
MFRNLKMWKFENVEINSCEAILTFSHFHIFKFSHLCKKSTAMKKKLLYPTLFALGIFVASCTGGEERKRKKRLHLQKKQLRLPPTSKRSPRRWMLPMPNTPS